MPRPDRPLVLLLLAVVALGLAGMATWGVAALLGERQVRRVLAETGFAEEFLFEGLDLHPLTWGVSLHGVRFRPADGVGTHHDLIAFDRVQCDHIERHDGLVTHALCAARNGTVHGDVAVGLAGVRDGIPWMLGRLPVNLDGTWTLDDVQRTFSASAHLHLPGHFSLGCDAAFDGLDHAAWRALGRILGRVGQLDPLSDPWGFLRQALDTADDDAAAIAAIAVDRAGCELGDDGMHASMRRDPTFGVRIGAAARMALAMIDPLSTDAVSGFLDRGGTLRLGTRVAESVPLFEGPEDGDLAPGPALTAPVSSTNFGVSWAPPTLSRR